MTGEAPYIDTGALAKWYLNEPRSDDFEAFITARPQAAISRLTVVEFRCLLARRRRSGDITRAIERRVLGAFEGDISRGSLIVHPLEDRHALGAAALISELSRHPLRTLDALHLAIAQDVAAPLIATADRVMADAASALGLPVERFHRRAPRR